MAGDKITSKQSPRLLEEPGQPLQPLFLKNRMGSFDIAYVIWHEALKQSCPVSFSATFTDNVKKAMLLATARYLRQQHSLKKIEDAFRTDSVPHAVFKGAHIRELIYSHPAFRAACDIDILVAKTDNQPSVSVAGFQAAVRVVIDDKEHRHCYTVNIESIRQILQEAAVLQKD